MDTSIIIKMIFGTAVRHLLTIAAGFLAAYGLSPEQADDFITTNTAVILAVLTGLIAVGWSYLNSWIKLTSDPPK